MNVGNLKHMKQQIRMTQHHNHHKIALLPFFAAKIFRAGGSKAGAHILINSSSRTNIRSPPHSRVVRE
jgi:hypothetical protein